MMILRPIIGPLLQHFKGYRALSTPQRVCVYATTETVFAPEQKPPASPASAHGLACDRRCLKNRSADADVFPLLFLPPYHLLSSGFGTGGFASYGLIMEKSSFSLEQYGETKLLLAKNPVFTVDKSPYPNHSLILPLAS
jgi:hypothetical protein